MSYAQQTIHGIVTDKTDSKPLSGSSVLLLDTMDNIVTYSIADPEGRYFLKMNDLQKGSFFIEASMLGYSKQRFKVDPLKSIIHFVLEPSKIELKEVKVTATKINQKGDTLNYTVASFKESQDMVIGDILKKIPGIDVGKDGTISYNGKAINKFYIEGLDLLEGKYNLATNNIPADAVSYVQIFENHQDKKVLQNKVFSDQAALNLKLTDKAKSKLLWKVEPGIGMKPIRWDADLFLLQLAKKIQGLNVYKTNNTGDDITNEIKVLTVESLINAVENKDEEPDLVSVPSIASPELSSKRFLFNNSHVISTNNLIQLINEYQLRVNVDYMNDVTRQTNSNYLKYLDENDTSLNIHENYQSVKKLNIVNIGATLTANKSNYYFRNSFDFKNCWTDNEIKSADVDWTNQRINIPKQSIKNDFSFISTKSNKTLEFHSFNFYNMLPQMLRITPGLYATDLNEGNTYNALSQNSKMMSFFSNTSFSVKKSKGRWSKEYFGGVIIQTQTIHSKLEKIEFDKSITVGDSVVNNFNLSRFQYQFKPTLEYFGEKLKFSFKMPVCFIILKANDRNNSRNETYNRFNILPTTNIYYQISTFWNIKLNYEYSITLGDIHEFVPAYMLYDYRTFTKNTGILKEQKRHIFTFGVYYKNPVKAIFSGISYIYIPVSSNTITDTKVAGALTWCMQSFQYNTSSLWMINGKVSKILDILPITLWLDVSANHNSAFQLFQNTLSEYANLSIQLKPRIHFRFASWSNLDYQVELSRTQTERLLPIPIKFAPINKTSHKVTWFFIPTKKMQFWFEGEYFKMKSSGNYYPDDLFLDTGVQYQFSSSSIYIEWRNLLNIKNYSYSSMDNLSITTGNYELRPTQALIKLSFTL